MSDLIIETKPCPKLFFNLRQVERRLYALGKPEEDSGNLSDTVLLNLFCFLFFFFYYENAKLLIQVCVSFVIFIIYVDRINVQK